MPIDKQNFSLHYYQFLLVIAVTFIMFFHPNEAFIQGRILKITGAVAVIPLVLGYLIQIDVKNNF
jgi:NhaP-type Na+/H+ or K+/H+ antiporter